jgi:hypothetical protein
VNQRQASRFDFAETSHMKDVVVFVIQAVVVAGLIAAGTYAGLSLYNTYGGN